MKGLFVLKSSWVDRLVHGLQSGILLGIVSSLPVYLNLWNRSCFVPVFAVIAFFRLAPSITLGSKLFAATSVTSSVLFHSLLAFATSSLASLIAPHSIQLCLTFLAPLLITPVVILRSWDKVAPTTRTWALIGLFVFGDSIITSCRVQLAFDQNTDAQELSHFTIAADSARLIWLRITRWMLVSGVYGGAAVALVALLIFPRFSAPRISRALQSFIIQAVGTPLSQLFSRLFNVSDEIDDDFNANNDQEQNVRQHTGLYGLIKSKSMYNSEEFLASKNNFETIRRSSVELKAMKIAKRNRQSNGSDAVEENQGLPESSSNYELNEQQNNTGEYTDEVDEGWIGTVPRTRVPWLLRFDLVGEREGRTLLLDADVLARLESWEPSACGNECFGSSEFKELLNSLHTLMNSLQSLRFSLDGGSSNRANPSLRRYSSYTLCTLLTQQARNQHVAFAVALVTHTIRLFDAFHALSTKLPCESIDSTTAMKVPMSAEFKSASPEFSESLGRTSTINYDELCRSRAKTLARLDATRSIAVEHVRSSLVTYFERIQAEKSWWNVTRAGELRALLFVLVMLHRLYRDMERVDCALNAFSALQFKVRLDDHRNHSRINQFWIRSHLRMRCLKPIACRLFAIDILQCVIREVGKKFKKSEEEEGVDSFGMFGAEQDEVKSVWSGISKRILSYLHNESVRFGIKLWLALNLTMVSIIWLIPSLGQYRLEWIYISVSLIFVPRVESVIALSVNRIAGTLLGGLLGGLVMAPHALAVSPYGIAAITAFIAFLTGMFYYDFALSRQYGALLFAATYLIVVFCQYNANSAGDASFAIERTVCVLIGVVISLIMNGILWPSFAGAEVDRLLLEVLRLGQVWFSASFTAFCSASQTAAARLAHRQASPNRSVSIESSEIDDEAARVRVGEVDVASFEQSCKVSLIEIRRILDSAQTIAITDLNSIPKLQFHLMSISYQLLVSLYAMRCALQRNPILLGEYCGSDYEVFLEPMKDAMYEVLSCVDELLRAIHAHIVSDTPSALLFWRKSQIEERKQLTKWRLEEAITKLDNARVQTRTLFIGLRRQLIAPVLNGEKTASEFMTQFRSDDLIRFYSVFFCWTIALNKFKLIGSTCAEISKG